MKNGRLAEAGTHGELLAMENGIYRRLYELQRELQPAYPDGSVGEETGPPEEAGTP